MLRGVGMDIRQVVAVQLREHRRRRKLTPAVLARHAGVDRALIRRLEDGKANPPLVVIGRLAEALGIEPQELLARPRGQRPMQSYPYPASAWSTAPSSSVADCPKNSSCWPPRHQIAQRSFACRFS
jgi:DNA-binding XRE family transcriptional regulator